MMKLSLAIQTPDVPITLPVALLEGTLEQKLSKAAQLGVDGVELMCVNPQDLDLADIKMLLKRNHLEVSAIATGAIYASLGISLLHVDPQKATQAQSLLTELIHMAADLSAPLVTIGSFRGWMRSSNLADWEKLQQILYSAAERAWQYGVRLAIEPLNHYETNIINNSNEGLQFLSQVSHLALGLLLDTYHVNIEENSWTLPFINVIQARKLFHVHVGDNNRLPPGRGVINFSSILHILQEYNYQGYLSAELLALPTPDEAGRQVVAYLQHSLDKNYRQENRL